MDATKNRENFNKCLDYIKANIHKLCGRELCIGFGPVDYSHPWMEKEFQNREYSLQINHDVAYNGVSIVVETYGGYYMLVYGQSKETIEKWKNGYRGTGMSCPDNRHTWDEMDVVPFLLDWPTIRAKFDAEIAKYETLDRFEV